MQEFIFAEILYYPYHEREKNEIKKIKEHRELKIPKNFIYKDIPGLSKELQQKYGYDSAKAAIFAKEEAEKQQALKKQAEEMGLDKIFKDANFEWRESGCSMCLGMNPDILSPGERCASTSNRNFEGRQGNGGRTHLVSPAMAAAAAIHGHFVDIRQYA